MIVQSCSYWKKVFQERRGHQELPERVEQIYISSLQKVQSSLSLTAILYEKEFVGKRLWKNLNWK